MAVCSHGTVSNESAEKQSLHKLNDSEKIRYKTEFTVTKVVRFNKEKNDYLVAFKCEGKDY